MDFLSRWIEERFEKSLSFADQYDFSISSIDEKFYWEKNRSSEFV